MTDSRTSPAIDATDRALMRLLAQDAGRSGEALGRALGLSASQAARRRARLEAAGILRPPRARMDPDALGLGVQAFVEVQMATHQPERARAFLRSLEGEARVTDVWTLTGEADYLLRVWCADLAALNALVHGVLLPHEAVARVQSRIVMAQPKADGPLPV